MKFVIAGGTGFLGNALAWTWAEEGHDVRVLTRSLPPGQSKHEPGTGKPGISRVGWSPDGKAGPAVGDVDGAAAVVNLAGESIAGARWTAARSISIESRPALATSVSGNISPMSPSPAAPRIASVIAWATASPSECPSRCTSLGIGTPPRTSGPPAAKRCES